ncbi:hypothetical protein M9H77_21794 [Catharanthus roseus]|uniref:Uncharacterized protein n=1 Tax=Catharanthus roseus TaxID=4058 RepID=A0ACC0AP21_CATRO|nr:hypothetical protein M9H77_21794 [Catharanthus roseus]
MSEEKRENSKEELNEIKLFLIVFIEYGDHFTFLNSLGTYLERKYFIEYNSISSTIPRVGEYDFNIANCIPCVLGVKDRRSMEKEDPSMSSSVMFDPSCYVFDNLDDTSFVKLNIIGFALEFDRNSLQHICTITSMRGRRHTMEFEGEGENVRGTIILCYGDLTMFFFKPIPLLPCVFLQIVKIVLRFECLLCDSGWKLYG